MLQLEGAEESQFFFCCDVWFKQQCSAKALQDLGGEVMIKNITVHILNKTLVLTCVTFYESVAENSQQDKKNLLRL